MHARTPVEMLNSTVMGQATSSVDGEMGILVGNGVLVKTTRICVYRESIRWSDRVIIVDTLRAGVSLNA